MSNFTPPASDIPDTQSSGTPRSAAPTISGIINLRDVGGYTTSSGQTVASGLLYRSGQLNVGSEAGRKGLEALELMTVFDLRTESERTALPDRVPSGVTVVHLDVLADAVTSVAAHIADLFEDPVRADELLRSGKIRDHYITTYKNLIGSKAACAAYQQMFLQIAALDGPALFHCTAGKDRTGWAAAALLSLLGVPEQVVLQDYLLSSAPVLEAFQSYLDEFAAKGGNPELLKPVFCVEPAYLATSMNEVQQRFGSMQEYFRTGLGLSDEVTTLIRQRMLTSAN